MIPQFFVVLLSLIQSLRAAPPAEPRYLETARVVFARPERGDVMLAGPDGNEILLREGDRLDEEGGAKLKDVASAVLIFAREASGADGVTGESIIVVRFNATGKTRVREYRAVGDVPTPKAPRPDFR